MPYRQIYWIKLEKRLLNDWRFYTLSKDGQLTYLKLLMLAAETDNRMPKDLSILLSSLRSDLKPPELARCVEEIKKNFPKFKETKHYYQFVGWKQRHNQVIPSISTGYALAHIDKIREEKIRVVRKEYLALQGWDEKNLIPSDYGRMGKRIKALLLMTKDDTDKVIEAMGWISKKGYEWTLETLIRKWPQFCKENKPVEFEN